MSESEEAQKAQIEAYLQEGKNTEALIALDKLLGVYARSKRVQAIIELMEELDNRYPQSAGIRPRLNMIYRRLGSKPRDE